MAFVAAATLFLLATPITLSNDFTRPHDAGGLHGRSDAIKTSGSIYRRLTGRS